MIVYHEPNNFSIRLKYKRIMSRIARLFGSYAIFIVFICDGICLIYFLLKFLRIFFVSSDEEQNQYKNGEYYGNYDVIIDFHKW